MTGTLYVVGTPIGNLDDITVRAVSVLRAVSLVAAEDTRVTSRLLRHLGISVPLVSCHAHNEERAARAVVAALRAGDDVALVTDAGTPGISDPGTAVVAACHDAQVPVRVVPGPSALAAAVSVAGIFGQGVRFWGFLPKKGARRKEAVAAIAADAACSVVYEAPGRLAATLAELHGACGDRMAAVARELTKVHEEVVRAPLGDLAARFADGVRGECVVVVSGADPTARAATVTDDALRDVLRRELAAGRSVKEVVAHVAAVTGAPRRRVYALALQLDSR